MNASFDGPGPARTFRALTIRGGPAIEVPEVDDNARAVLYSGRSTTVVLAAGLGVARSVARILRSVDGRIAPRDRLPRHVEGHLTGKARCK